MADKNISNESPKGNTCSSPCMENNFTPTTPGEFENVWLELVETLSFFADIARKDADYRRGKGGDSPFMSSTSENGEVYSRASCLEHCVTLANLLMPSDIFAMKQQGASHE